MGEILQILEAIYIFTFYYDLALNSLAKNGLYRNLRKFCVGGMYNTYGRKIEFIITHENHLYIYNINLPHVITCQWKPQAIDALVNCDVRHLVDQGVIL